MLDLTKELWILPMLLKIADKKLLDYKLRTWPLLTKMKVLNLESNNSLTYVTNCKVELLNLVLKTPLCKLKTLNSTLKLPNQSLKLILLPTKLISFPSKTKTFLTPQLNSPNNSLMLNKLLLNLKLKFLALPLKLPVSSNNLKT